ncbi:MAG: DUF2259 domain-containing protein [Rhizobiales bacterium]|nr:DUF2259 domain-containing protein [Hyphomicrobiales bacterium]
MSRLLPAAFLVAMALPAAAGEFAEREIIGFSPDGARFAFEEFGVQDGSGFPFCNIFVVDTATDSWVKGTPIRRLVEDEGVRVATACGLARADAAPFIADLDDRGNLLASNPITESGRDPYSLAFKRWPELVLENGDLLLRLETIPLPAPEGALPDRETAGFRLVLNDGAKDVLLHEDKTLPASRGTAFDYRISDVVMQQPFNAPPTIAVLVLVIQRGFEGASGRYVVVTKRLPQ